MVSHYFVHTPVHTRIGWLRDRYLEKIPVSHPRREQLAQYGAMVTTLDHHVGELLASIDEAGLADSTLVVFTSDNGGHPEYAGNAPLRGSKWNLHEGGIRVPFLARWPDQIHTGSTSEVPVTGTDLLATFADVAGAVVPDGQDGRSILPVLTDADSDLSSRDLIWHFPYYHPETGFDTALPEIGIDDGLTSQTRPHSVVRSGSWKLIHFYEDDRDELYQLITDPAEQTDRCRSEPSVAARLRRSLDAALSAANARKPIPNPDWKQH
jgi:uncharacterized sulfatase